MHNISKESFCKVMNFIKSKDIDSELFNKSLSQLDKNSNVFLFIYADYESVLVNLLEEIYDTDMISYFIYETNWGEKADKYYVTDENGVEYHIHTVEELYEYITMST